MGARPHSATIAPKPKRTRPAEPSAARPTAGEHSAADALAQSEHRYLALADTCGQPILIESDGKIVFANAAAGELFAVQSFRDLLGKGLHDLIPSLRDVALTDVAAAGPSRFKPHVLARADGAAFDVEIGSDPCSFDGRAAVQIVVRGAKERES